MGGYWKWVMWLRTNMWMSLRSFRGEFWVSREMNKWRVQGLFEEMRMVPSTGATLQVTSAFLGAFREKIWPGPEKSRNLPKTTKIEGYIIHAFGLSRGPTSECHGMPSRDMGGHSKGVIWLGTNMWMSLRSLRDKLGFYEKWTNGVFRGFSRQHKWCQAPAQHYKLCQIS